MNQPVVKLPYPYREARLSESGNNLKKRWVVCYYIFCVDRQKLVRKRITVQDRTLEQRMNTANTLINEVNRLLQAGYHLNSARPATPVVLKTATPVLDRTRLTVVQAAGYYLQVKRKELRVDTTLKLYEGYLSRFNQFLVETGNEQLLLKHLSPRLAHEFFDSVDVGARYYNNMLGFFKSFARFYLNREDIDKNPFQSLSKLRVDESDDHRPFNAEQTREIRDAILATGDEQLWLFCQFIYFLFMRPGRELRLLQVRDILASQVKVTSETAKNRRIGHVDISTALEQIIDHYKLRFYRPTHYVFSVDGHPGASPVGINYFYKRHAKIMKQLDLFDHDYDLYSWKPTGAVALYRSTKDMLRVQKHCRHATPDQTYTYLRKYGLVFEGVDMTNVPAIWDNRPAPVD